MSRPRSRPAVHFAYAGDWYDGPIEGLVRVDGRSSLVWFRMISESHRRRTYAAYETPHEFVTIIRAERRLFERLVYGRPTCPRPAGGGLPARWKRWYEVYQQAPAPRPQLGRVLFTFTDRGADYLPGCRHRWRKALADRGVAQ